MLDGCSPSIVVSWWQKREMLAAISIGLILAVLVTLNLIGLSIVAYRIMRRK